MITLKLTRYCYNKAGTYGILECPQYNFKCRTIERPYREDLDKVFPNQRVKYCLPFATYPLRWESDIQMRLRPYVSVFGCFAHAMFVESSFDMSPGSICLTKTLSLDAQEEGSDEIVEALSKMMLKMLMEAVIPDTPKTGYLQLEIVKDDSFGLVADVELDDEDDVDWNFI